MQGTVVAYYISLYEVVILFESELGEIAVVKPCRYIVKLSRVIIESFSLIPSLYKLPLLKLVLYLSISLNCVLTLGVNLKLVVFLELVEYAVLCFGIVE
jgi:hypothetical protein